MIETVVGDGSDIIEDDKCILHFRTREASDTAMR